MKEIVIAQANLAFTLIELMVVIAIIGMLSSVVLSSVNSARSKGNDAAIRANLSTIRTQSAIFYDNNSGWSNGGSAMIVGASPITVPTMDVCNSAAGANVPILNDPQIVKAMQAADKAAGGNANPTSSIQANTAKVRCSIDGTTPAYSKPTFWTITAPFTASAKWWCVDSVGNAKQEDSFTLSATGACQ